MPQESDYIESADARRMRRPTPVSPALADPAPPEVAPAGAMAPVLERLAGGSQAGAAGPGSPHLSLQRRHAHLLGDPRLGRTVNAQRRADLLLQLQRSYGNRHVQRVMGLLNGAPAPTAAPVQRADTPAPAPTPAPTTPAPAPTTPAPAAAPQDPQLLLDFANSFGDAATLIRNSPVAMKLVQDADTANVKFGGFAETGPGQAPSAYTYGDSVYVPQARTDKVVAMNDFLFELNNASRAPEMDKLVKEAAKGSTGSLTPQDYARQCVTIEVEGLLRMGEVWFETKKTMGNGPELNQYDEQNYLADYQDYQAGRITKETIINNVLGRTYTEGADAGKTVEQYYMERYQQVSGGK